MLSPLKLALLATRLQVPLIIDDVLRDEGALTPDVQYGLHEVLSELQPDTALLSIAVSARKIASIFSKASPSAGVLEIECDRIIDDYGALWLQNAGGESVAPEDALNLLTYTAEDLEGLAELLELNVLFLAMKDKVAAALCDILRIQAAAQAVIAESVLEMERAQTRKRDMPNPDGSIIVKESNIIPFPVALQN